MNNIQIKEQLQKFFNKDIWSISKKGDLYYVTLDLDKNMENSVVYETNIKGQNILQVGISLPELEKMELIYSKYINQLMRNKNE